MTGEWLTLLLLVPAILIPVVLLWGFTGCAGASLADPFLPPADVRATGISVSVISLTWDNPNHYPVRFEIHRTKEGETDPETLVSGAPFDDAGLSEACSYSYRVRAVSSSQGVSAMSEPAIGRTIGVAFEAELTVDRSGLEGFCVVQRIEPARLRQSTLAGGLETLGARVKITLRGSAAGTLTLDRIYISQPAASGDPYDSGPDLTHVASGIVVPPNAAVPLPLVDYDLDKNHPLLVAFDISATAGPASVRAATGFAADNTAVYLKPAAAEAANGDRSPSAADPAGSPYVSSPTVYLVEKIEVM